MLCHDETRQRCQLQPPRERGHQERPRTDDSKHCLILVQCVLQVSIHILLIPKASISQLCSSKSRHVTQWHIAADCLGLVKFVISHGSVCTKCWMGLEEIAKLNIHNVKLDGARNVTMRFGVIEFCLLGCKQISYQSNLAGSNFTFGHAGHAVFKKSTNRISRNRTFEADKHENNECCFD